jgi:hypothetical protein
MLKTPLSSIHKYPPEIRAETESLHVKYPFLNSSVFWNITLGRPLKINRRFDGTCGRHVQGQRISHTRNQHEAAS